MELGETGGVGELLTIIGCVVFPRHKNLLCNVARGISDAATTKPISAIPTIPATIQCAPTSPYAPPPLHRCNKVKKSVDLKARSRNVLSDASSFFVLGITTFV